ncbi:hypothetical protein [Mesorhizobium caraganae]|uniref:hypothetical protein n=1 Tax=Mesorhizobium caraganae TaxID=483206 RepID=UPI0035E456F9
MLICYDKSWPEACRELTLSGAELLVIGSAWAAMLGHGERENNSSARDCTRPVAQALAHYRRRSSLRP